jgi:hypothetical protein
MWDEEGFGVWSDLIDNSVIFSQNKLKLIVVHLKFILLKKYNFGTLGNINSDSGKAFSLSNEGEDLGIEIDIELIILRVPDYESGLKTSFSLLDFMSPFLSPEVLKGEQGITNLVIHFDESS